jgi:quinohemoprotein ethanol dehydrogenase
MAYSPATGLVYIPAIESAMVYANLMPARGGAPDPAQWLNVYTSFPEEYEPDDLRSQFGVVAPPLADLVRGQSIPRLRGVLRAWNPRAGKVAWERESAFYADGGTLATAGGLVFQGSISGELIALSADDGRELLRLQTGSSMIAGPMTYSVGGVQYVAIMAGLGGSEGWVFPVGSAAYKYGNEGRLLAFKLDGKPPQLPTEIADVVPVEPPAQTGTADDIARGQSLFVENCAMCHANSGRGLVPDLRRLSPSTHAAFDAIVRGGALTSQGMPSFSNRLSEADAQRVHAYLIDEASKLRRGLSTAPLSQQHQ